MNIGTFSSLFTTACSEKMDMNIDKIVKECKVLLSTHSRMEEVSARAWVIQHTDFKTSDQNINKSSHLMIGGFYCEMAKMLGEVHELVQAPPDTKQRLYSLHTHCLLNAANHFHLVKNYGSEALCYRSLARRNDPSTGSSDVARHYEIALDRMFMALTSPVNASLYTQYRPTSLLTERSPLSDNRIPDQFENGLDPQIIIDEDNVNLLS